MHNLKSSTKVELEVSALCSTIDSIITKTKCNPNWIVLKTLETGEPGINLQFENSEDIEYRGNGFTTNFYPELQTTVEEKAQIVDILKNKYIN